ncbi:hypothetical protein MLD38_019998 [Melastoma candidum]|uniref:Uncharacterized protein n=1 Tax=Melastoma candidum TaxID=119954 RepID=A0ACB9QEI5_9MYRT|nr:hypothetical protein MLD38_019998 [Melastoma candidum]
MKKTGLLAASVAATATAISSASPASPSSSPNNGRRSKPHPHVQEEEGKDGRTEASARFAPRFDGLRFIETLVTAHR